jgi:2-C-methyl-D-erythritol 4-phosphate cytidylyltransferase
MAVALLLAAGSGERLGAGRPKGLVALAGRPLLEWSLDALRASEQVERIAIALPPDGLEEGRAGFAQRPAEAQRREPTVVCVAGGASRSASVRSALHAIGPGDPVVVHDAARPLLRPALVAAAIAALADDSGADAAIAAAAVTDTIKRADAERAVLETLDRGALWSIQTPQVFRRAALEHALDVGEEELALATDDAWLVERRGGRVLVVPAPHDNLKVTTPLDLRVAELLLAERGGRS